MEYCLNYSGTRFFFHWKLKLLNFPMNCVLKCCIIVYCLCFLFLRSFLEHCPSSTKCRGHLTPHLPSTALATGPHHRWQRKWQAFGISRDPFWLQCRPIRLFEIISFLGSQKNRDPVNNSKYILCVLWQSDYRFRKWFWNNSD